MQSVWTSYSRRDFLKAGLEVTVGIGCASLCPSEALAESAGDDLIRRIERTVIFGGRKTGATWFHPRVCMAPEADGNLALMTLQTIGGPDFYGPVHWTVSKDMGATWSRPEPIPGLGRRALGDGWKEGVCDVVPEYHPQTRTVLAVGCNVYYRDGALAQPQRSRWPIYAVRSADGKWSPPRKLEWDDPRGKFIYSCGCSQRVTLPDGDVLIPLNFKPKDDRPHYAVNSALCSFDGRTLAIRKVGNDLSHPVRSGLLEPSMVCFRDRYYMTIRAEDNRGYVTVSDDGLQWRPQRPWTWDDGAPLVTSTTQQHWLPHSERLFLVYTRKDAVNVNVFRWRAPLFMAEVDRRTLRLIRASERIVLPLLGDGVRDAKHVAWMGNFHTVAAGPDESWVTVGEARPHDGWVVGDTLLARIHWHQW